MTLPRFSLRLLLLAVAVLCAWLAWERSVVMERRRMVEDLQRDPSVEVHLVPTHRLMVFVSNLRRISSTRKDVPWVREMMGDQKIIYVHFRSDEDPRIEGTHELLPEAYIEAGKRFEDY